MFSSVHCWNLSWTTWIQSTHPHPVSVRYIYWKLVLWIHRGNWILIHIILLHMKHCQLTRLQNMNYILTSVWSCTCLCLLMLQLHVLALCLGWALSLCQPVPIILSMIAVRVITEDILLLFYFHFQSDLISVLMHSYFCNFPQKKKFTVHFSLCLQCMCVYIM